MSILSELELRKISGGDGCFPVGVTTALTLADFQSAGKFPNAKRIVAIQALTDTVFTSITENGVSATTKYFGFMSTNSLPASGFITSKRGFDGFQLASGEVLVVLADF